MPSQSNLKLDSLGPAETKALLNALLSFKKGDFNVRLPTDWLGLPGKIADAFNIIIETADGQSKEFAQISKEVGKEGRIEKRVSFLQGYGAWRINVDSINNLIGDLIQPMSEMGRVVGAVASGDLSKKMPITVDGKPLKGAFLTTVEIVNSMVTQLNAFSSEVTRVAREVGTEGKLGGQAKVTGVSGTWKDLTQNVNLMANNLTLQVRNIAEVTKAVASGDLSKKITVDVKGEILELKNTINTMVDQLSSFASEVTRVAREVGTEGKLGGQATVKGVSGTWKDLTDNVNQMASNLTAQVRNIAEVTTAVANGDLSKKITVDVKGEIFELKNTINTMMVQLNSFASEVTRVAREVGTEGKLGGQAEVEGVGGTWKDLTENVNLMASNLTAQVRNIADVTTAVANGDLSKKITVDVKGEILELKNTINIMVDQLNSFASEVTRVAREVGTEGKLGGQAEVTGVGGTWKDLTENVNLMASNLTAQVRNIADVTTAVANGDLSKKITVDVKGEILELKNTINIMVDQLNSFASEVTRVAREVGTEGKLGGQAEVTGIGGTWKDLTENVNLMASNLTAQVRNIAGVTTAVANGDLSKKITVDVKGEILELKNTINIMVDQLNSFASEVTRVAREVGTEGKLGGQAEVTGLGGTWKDLTQNVNMMANNLTDQVRNIAEVTTAVATGDLSKKITVDVRGEFLQLKDTINTMVEQLRTFASEVTRVAREVGTEGKLGGQAYVQGMAGTWKDLTENVNLMASNLTNQVRNIAGVTTAVANGDLSKKITVDVKGEIFELKNTINTMVDQLNSFASEVTRVAREVGTEGKLGGQAAVKGVSGTWKDLTDSVNLMATNLTDQVRGIAMVVTAVAKGDLEKQLVVQAKGEIAELTDTINSMINTLSTFAEQVTTVAREVGVEGKLGGQANVPGASGIWKDLTENVNQLAANLTTQVRAISEVAQAVTKGDLTRTIRVEALGEVAVLKDIINEMINNLKDTTLKNTEQDWLKTNLAKFTRMLQGQKDLMLVAKQILSELAPVVNSQHALFYIMDNTGSTAKLRMLASYAFKQRKNLSNEFAIGEGLVGQCAFEKERILLNNVPDDYVYITSGLGESAPLNIILLPVLFEGQVKAVIELASFDRFSIAQQALLDQLTESIGIVLNTIEANSRTEELLKQSQSMAQELQSQQEELQQTNEELEEKAKLLVEQNNEVENKNREVERSRKSLEEKAEQLALTSKYKSEFLANMSHELRTPLNSLLLLSKQLSENRTHNLTKSEVEYANTIYSSGVDLLNLINDILDLSKIESGTVEIDITEISPKEIYDNLYKMFCHVAEEKGLTYTIELAPDLPKTIFTDVKKLLQILKNLLSNAFKFTAQGTVKVDISTAKANWSIEHLNLNRAKRVIAFSVMDTGIGVAKEKQKIIFEAFQQADGSTSRRYGGTGLGLSISREIAKLLGGEICLISEEGKGCNFTLYLPQDDESNLKRKTFDEDAQKNQQGGRFLEKIAKAEEEDLNKSEGITLGHENKETPVREISTMIADDQTEILTKDRVVLIIEDDLAFANLLLEKTHEQGFKGIVTTLGADGIELANHYLPDAITLDLHLPDMDGWRVLDTLKETPSTRHIPIHLISADEESFRGFRHGAKTFLVKPVTEEKLQEMFETIKNFSTKEVKQLLVVEDEEIMQQSIVELLKGDDVEITVVGTVKDAWERLAKTTFDCMVMDLGLPDKNGFELLEEIGSTPMYKNIPIIIYTGKELTRKEEMQLRKVAQSIIVKNVASRERLLDETTLFLHRVHKKLSKEKRKVIEKLHSGEELLAGKKVLIVDDDYRNIFALAGVLEVYQMNVLTAENGKVAIEILKANPDVDIVLMDIMMPEMDGYEAMREIRKNPKFKKLPIIAVTAKAMKGDREKCLEAGAFEYIAKPVDIERLVSMFRVLLYQ
ncbi:HAMP domain-containing protein [Legionella maioricensis]|uniref:histidine kinase n=1 Tax=Legionella maioricensis TaxID=2896528 RepID=A0A9X2CXS0_9GAMM|nr:HAMP domain-containing protein [Legionella maioricensis]MCL9682712.1 HAMP domain-containing protein [Legionella maioricensis]MCL9687240.1 HAMP domain-containing protein [Legionella maioricensis]